MEVCRTPLAFFVPKHKHIYSSASSPALMLLFILQFYIQPILYFHSLLHFTMKISAILSLAPLAAALPGSRHAARDNNGVFGVTAARSTSPIHLLPLTASGGHFYLGGKSQTYTPQGVPHSGKQTNDTLLTGDHFLVRSITIHPMQNLDTNEIYRMSSSPAASASTSTPRVL